MIMLNDVKERNTDIHAEQVEEVNDHEHQLMLVDLQLLHRDYIEYDDEYDDKDLIDAQNFKCVCNKCGRQIDWYHRYYFKCSHGGTRSCNYAIHKFCEELPRTLTFPGHPSHTLVQLKKATSDDHKKCCSCHRDHQDDDDMIYYHCSSATCDYEIDLLCATFVEQNMIHHPSHPHPLISISVERGLYKCIACGKRHEGHFYHCTTCFNFLINSDCLSLPIKLLLKTQKFSHRHILTLSYSFLDRLYHDLKCRICGRELEDRHFIYKCSKCMYYVHPHCATQVRIQEDLPTDVDHHNVVHFPVSDESNILSHLIKGKTCGDENAHKIEHFSHKHPLVLINSTGASTSTTKSMSLHDPKKRIKLLCNGCVKPVTKMPFYKCSNDYCKEDFVLHDWCTRLPKEVNDGSHEHTLLLDTSEYSLGLKCIVCELDCNGFRYRCGNCLEYVVDAVCAFIPEEITHEAHANHLLKRVNAALFISYTEFQCDACSVSIDKSEVFFRCGTCPDFFLHSQCALHLPKTIEHKLDKHPLELSYSPVEDHKSEYFCEVCEQELNPGKWFYHCVKCDQSIHSACAPLILKSEQGVNSNQHLEGVYKFLNFKPRLYTRIKHFHEHSNMLLVPGTENDGLCARCDEKLQSTLVFKCLSCNYATHAMCHFLGILYRLFKIHDSLQQDRVKNDRPQKDLKFYPSEMMRPETRHWEQGEAFKGRGRVSTPLSHFFRLK